MTAAEWLKDLAAEYDVASKAADMMARGLQVHTNVRPRVLAWAIKQRAKQIARPK